MDFLARLIAKILAINLKDPRSWQQMKKIQDLGKNFKIIQDYPRSWQENQDAKHWANYHIHHNMSQKYSRALFLNDFLSAASIK